MAVTSLESLLAQKKIDPNEKVTARIHVSRLGETIEVTFKRLTYKKYKYFKQSALVGKRGEETFDIDKYRNSVVLDCLLDPDFSKKEFLDSFGAPNGEVGLNMIFLPGELVAIGEIILRESGFDDKPFQPGVSDDEESTED